MKKLTLALCLLAFVGAAMAQVDTLFYDGFEAGLDWETGDLYWYDDTAYYWHADTFMAYEGESYWCGTFDVGGTGYNGYNDGWLQYMDMPEVFISPTATSVALSFVHRLKCEPAGSSGWPFGYNGWDGADMWISTDHGDSWSVLEPDAGSAYDCTSLWGFGFCNLGPGYPAWTGTHGATAYEPISADLSAYAGEDVIVRFVFSSDMMFCTGPTHADPPNFDASFFGWLVDDIAIVEDSDTLLFDDGSGSPTFGQGRQLRTWTRTDEDAHSGEYSVIAYDWSEIYSTITSPMISLPDTFNGELTFYVKTNCVDFDPDSDNSLDDYISVYVIDSTMDTTVQIAYNYYRPGFIDETWRIFDESVLFGSSMTTSLLQFAGHDIRLMFLMRGDGMPDSTQWFKIDDVTISGNYAPLHDIGPTDIVASPLNFRDHGRFTVKVSNLGMSRETLLHVDGKITFPDMTDTTISFFPWPTVDPGKFGTAVAQILLPQSGTYTVRAWTSLSTDMDVSNDTFETTFEVYDASTRELGWDDGMTDIATDPTSGRSYDGFLGPSFTAGDYLGNFFYETAGLTDMQLTHVKFFTNYNGPVSVMVLDNGIFDIPNGGTELYEGEHTVSSDSIDGSWVTIDLSADPIDLSDSTFFVFIGTAIDSQMPVVGIDNTTPVDRKGFAILHYFDSTGTLIAIDTSDLASASAPLNNIDLMIRCVITGINGIGDDGAKLPRVLALRDNYPNPFNPATAIEFDLPEDQKASLDVYNVLGERVTSLVNDNLKAGTYRIVWEGRDDFGREMPSGIYLYRLHAGDKTISKRMIMIK